MSLFNKKSEKLANQFKEKAEDLNGMLNGNPFHVPEIDTGDRTYMYGFSGWSGISHSAPYREEPKMIFCGYCDSANYPYQIRCSSCGAPFTRKEFAESNPLKAIQEMVEEGYQLLDFLQKRREKYISDEKLKESILGGEK